MLRWYTVAFLSAVLTLHAGDAVNVSGAWRLDLERSVWGSRPKPVSVALNIEHNEPALTYTGVVIYSGEDVRPFSFNGAIDGKPYEMNRSFGSGAVVLRRIDSVTFESIFRTKDSKWVETTRTYLMPDGKTLTRRIRLQSPNGISTSTEVYHRQ